MKEHLTIRIISLVFICLCTSVAVLSQEISTKYGRVTNEELAMTVYEPDTTANAVIIFKKGHTSYEFVTDHFRVTYEVEMKIKILKPEGTTYADVAIPYYQNDKNTTFKETVSNIEAIAYNLEGGKVEKTKMKRDYIFRERLNSNRMQVKFSIPAVKAGTVIEYKYKMYSDFYSQLDNWVMQHDIPVIYANYNITIPEYYKFNLDMRGAEKIQTEDNDVQFSLHVGGQILQCSGRNLVFTCNNVPALKTDSYIWCPTDYRSQINFELDGVNYPWTTYQSFTTTWNDIDKLLLEDDDFGKLMRMKNPFQEETRAVLKEDMSLEDKIGAVFTLLKQKINWDESYRLTADDIKKAIKNGTGSNADINFVLMSMLRDAGISSVPVVMSRRSQGVLPLTHPSIQKINTFVVGIQNSDTTMLYLDGSVRDGYINSLPPVLMVNRARIISPNAGQKWVNLSAIGTNQIRSLINVTINEEGDIEGTSTSAYTGQFANQAREAYRTAKDSTEYIEKKEEKGSIKIKSHQCDKINEFAQEIRENFHFTKSVSEGGEYLYINPMVFPHVTSSPFIQETRKLPVELPYPYSMRISNTITIPEGYVVEELPKPATISLDDSSSNCRYVIQTNGDKVMLTYVFYINRTLFLPNEYQHLKTFWEAVVEKNNEMIVLKKVAQ